MHQLSLFPDTDPQPAPAPAHKPQGGSRNPIVFHDYASYVAKFQTDAAKTTDDTYTPPDVFDAVLKWLRQEGLIQPEAVILRPFYPGGDYLHAVYPPGGVVIDNPPFSQFSKICRFYAARAIPFFLFGPGMTILSCADVCTAVIAGAVIKFHNGAKVRVNFATNLIPGSPCAVTAPGLLRAIQACPSQHEPVRQLPKYRYPSEVISVSRMHTIAGGGVRFAVPRSACAVIRSLDLHPKGRGGVFGNHLLVSTPTAEEARRAAEEARRAAAEEARRAAEEARAVPIQLSPREQAIVRRLSQQTAHQ